MGFAVYHVEKGKGSGGGLGNHIDRIKGKEHSYKNADPERLHLNQAFKVLQGREKMPLQKAIQDRIEKGYNGKRKVRIDSVNNLKHIVTGSHKDMKEIFANKPLATEWILANRQFIIDEYGAENIVRMNLHLDEKTPHLHFVTVPLTKDGRLSAKEVVGNKKQMQLRQDRYAEAMKKFGLERGIRNTGIKHENASDYYKRIEIAQKNSSQSVLEPVKSILGINKDKTIEKYKEALKSANLALNEIQIKLKTADVKVNSTDIVRERNENLKQINIGYKRHLDELRLSQAKEIKALEASKVKAVEEMKRNGLDVILDPEKTKQVREMYQKQLDENQSRSRGRGR